MTKVAQQWTKQAFAGLDLGDARQPDGEANDGTIFGQSDGQHHIVYLIKFMELSMISTKINRRDLIKVSASAIALHSLSSPAFGQTSTKIRLEWQEFKSTPQYSSYLYAIGAMRANTKASSPSSWLYWTNIHVNYCPHGIAYFLAWHRGYIFYFERQLQIISQDTSLTLPYWDYYKYPLIPSEFLDPASNNPLYVPRVNANVYNALDLSPFDSSVYNFQRGAMNAFEPKIESAPHNPIHNIIGGYMADMQSPMDPIFFLHHANIDRLWHAWALPDGKGIPTSTDTYWSGSFTYASKLTLSKSKTYYPGWLGYDYSNDNKPTSMPLQAQAARILRVQAQMERIWRRPPAGRFAASLARNIARDRRSIGGVKNVALDENSVSAHVSLASPDKQSLQNILSTLKSAAPQTSAGPYKSVKIVFDNAKVTGGGKYGGYFYNVYLNLPESDDATSSRQRFFLGTFGAFELAGAAHHGSASVEFPATEVLANIEARDMIDLTVSLVRVNGQNAPKGQAMYIGELRVEISTDEPWDRIKPDVRRGNEYR